MLLKWKKLGNFACTLQKESISALYCKQYSVHLIAATSIRFRFQYIFKNIFVKYFWKECISNYSAAENEFKNLRFNTSQAMRLSESDTNNNNGDNNPAKEGPLHEEQKGIQKKSCGTRDKFLIIKSVLNCKRRHTNLAMTWID